MFGFTLVLFIVLASSYLLLRKLTQLALSRRPKQREVLTGGLFSWLFVLSVAGWGLWTMFLLLGLLTAGMLGSILSLVFIGVGSGVALYFREVLDASAVWDYVRTTLFFHPYASQLINFHEELDKKEIKDIYHETSEKPFPTVRKEKPLLTAEEVARLRREVRALTDRPMQSARLKEELRQLTAGECVNVSDQWKIYTFGRSLHEYYESMSDIQIDPAARALRFRLDIRDATTHTLRDAMYVFHLNQDLYQLMQVLNGDRWLKPYSDFYNHFETTCFGIEADSFGLVQHYPFLHLRIARTELLQREGMFFNAADLDKISTLIFDDGKPLQL